jgi:hypothetical protein
MNTKILEKVNFILIKDNIEFIKKHLYTYFDKTKTHISIITHVKDSVIVINIKNNPKGDEISWIVINGSGNNTTIHNHFKANSMFKFSKHKTISTDIENIRTNSKDIDFVEILKSMNREKLLNELL